MSQNNLLILMTDQHSRKYLSCYGNPIVKTPSLDTLATDGSIFTSASTNSPICVPSRASLATGRYVHEIGCWDNAIAYDGKYLAGAIFCKMLTLMLLLLASFTTGLRVTQLDLTNRLYLCTLPMGSVI